MIETLLSWNVLSWLIASALTIGGLFLTMAEADYKKAKVCFLLAAIMAEAGIFMWGIKTPVGNDIARWFICFVAFGLVGVLAVEAVRYVDRRRDAALPKATVEAKPEPTPTPNAPLSEHPHVFVRLVIDSVDRRQVDYHLQVENGAYPIKNIRVSSETAEFVGIENEQLPRMLPPNKQLRISGVPAVFKPKKQTNLTVQISYTAEIKGTDKEFISKYRFLVRAEDLKRQTIDPEFRTEEEGSLNPTQQLEDLDIPAQLTHPLATLFFILDEVSNGEPNIVNIGNPQRRFEFNPISRTVSFETKAESGRVINLELPLKETKSGKHIIILMWNPTGGFLSVDGVEKQDMKIKQK